MFNEFNWALHIFLSLAGTHSIMHNRTSSTFELINQH